MKKRIFALIAAMLLMVSTAIAEGESADAARGFETPEECMRAVADALTSLDMDAYLNCFAISEAARGVDAYAYTGKLGALIYASSPLPPVNELNIAMNEASLTNAVMLRTLFGSVVLSGADNCQFPTQPIRTKDFSDAALKEALESAELYKKLTWLEAVDAATLDKNYADSREKSSWTYAAYGFGKWEEMIAMMDYEGERVGLALGVVEVEGRWLASPLKPILAYYLREPGTHSLVVTEDML